MSLKNNYVLVTKELKLFSKYNFDTDGLLFKGNFSRQTPIH